MSSNTKCERYKWPYAIGDTVCVHPWSDCDPLTYLISALNFKCSIMFFSLFPLLAGVKKRSPKTAL